MDIGTGDEKTTPIKLLDSLNNPTNVLENDAVVHNLTKRMREDFSNNTTRKSRADDTLTKEERMKRFKSLMHDSAGVGISAIEVNKRYDHGRGGGSRVGSRRKKYRQRKHGGKHMRRTKKYKK
jgi:hypothetical protein